MGFLFLVKLRMVLRANETREWNEITENVMNIDLQDLNSNPLIRENDIVFESFEKGCLVINLNISDGFPIKTLLHIVFEILFEELKATVILQKYETSEVQIFGYFYCPEEFKKKGRCLSFFFYQKHIFPKEMHVYFTLLQRQLLIY